MTTNHQHENSTNNNYEGLRGHFIRSPRAAEGDAPPASYTSVDFEVRGPVVSAVLRYTAFGIVEPHLNGTRLNDDRFLPGWSDYRKRLYVVEEPVAERLRPGQNSLGFILGNGWAGIVYGPWEHAKCLVPYTALAVELDIRYADGTTQKVFSDPQWRWELGPVTAQSLYHGESYDARLEIKDWASPQRGNHAGEPGVGMPDPGVILAPRKCPPVRVTQTLPAVKVWKTPDGEGWLIDFGQNLVGVPSLRVAEEQRGCHLTMKFGEMLQSDGNLYTENLRSARATDFYTCSGGGEIVEPRWTFHGFRYMEIRGLTRPPAPADIRALVLHNDLRRTGVFETSSELINRLQSCIVWGQRGNFLEAPTDCPQRDERLGWSCDAQVFAKTACFNYDCEDFYRQWMDAMRDGQREDGAFADLAPDVLGWHGNAGWGDAGVIVPHVVWKFYGRTRIIEENWEAMVRYIDFLLERGDDLIQPDTVYGDWLAVDAARPEWGATPKDMIGTAYFARDAGLMAEMATATGRSKEAGEYAGLRERIRDAFLKRFVTPDGLVLGDTQTSYLCALGFDLLPERLVERARGRLVEKLKAREWHLSTGFLGTPLLNPVLSRNGLTDIAYRLLEQQTYPGWLYPVLNGATTMWERWNSWSHENGFGPVEMNSFNHYAFGAIGEWLYATVAGLDMGVDSDTGTLGLTYAPCPGGTMIQSANASLLTPWGLAGISWMRDGQSFTLKLSVPEGTAARLILPVEDWGRVTVNGEPAPGCESLRPYSSGIDGCRALLAAGDYQIGIAVEEFVCAESGAV